MAVTVSLAVLFGVLLAVLLKQRALGFGSALVAALFGFYLASTGAAGPIRHFTATAVHALTSIH